MFEITEFNLSKEKNFRWRAETKTMDKEFSYQYADGGIGHFDCVRFFQNLKQIKRHIREFAKLNEFTRYKIIKKNNESA